MKNGFTLLELSIVLVIIGLIIGGITAGADLIRGAELNSIVSQKNQYEIGFNAFKLKYNALPGDIDNAEAYWGTALAADAACQTASSFNGTTCNGDGDGNIEGTSTRSREIHRAWQHLANAEIISGSFTGAQGSGGTLSVTAGVNAPESPTGTGGWAIVANSDASSLGGWYGDIFPINRSRNWLQLGRPVAADNQLFSDPLLTPTEAFNIDTKIDDGKPGSGGVTTGNTTASANCASNDTASTATYVLSTDTATCTLYFGL